MAIFEVSIVAYFGVGLVATAVWPLRKQFVDSYCQIREEQSTAIKTIIFFFVIVASAILLWPFFLIGNSWGKAKRQRMPSLSIEKKAKESFEVIVTSQKENLIRKLRSKEEDDNSESLLGDPSELESWFEEQILTVPLSTLNHAKERNRLEWKMSVLRRFEKDCRKVDRKLQERAKEALSAIWNDPMAPNGDTKKPLDGNLSGMWRYRIGDYRVVYRPDSNSRTIIIIAFGPRQEIYARFAT